VILLSDISFQSTYSPVYEVQVNSAGLAGAMNTTLVGTPAFNLTATAQFWWYYPALLTDGQNSKAVTPINCTGDNCNSFFLPGPMALIEFNQSKPPITANQYPDAISFIQNDAPGYQIDFEPIDYEHDPPITLDDCKVFGIHDIAVQICLKKVNSWFFAGTFNAHERLTDISLELVSIRRSRRYELFKYNRLANRGSIQHEIHYLRTSRLYRFRSFQLYNPGYCRLFRPNTICSYS